MAAILEREVKLRFDSAEAARAAVLATGATPTHGRRFQEDCLLDTDDENLHRRRSGLRVRIEGGKSLLTFKGPVQPSDFKIREEIETIVGDCIIAIDETPVGVFVEIEGGERGIENTARALGRAPCDYLLDSYRGLFLLHCQQHGTPRVDMLFDD